MELKQVKRKVLLLGDGAVGKTSLIKKFVTDKFDDKYQHITQPKNKKDERRVIHVRRKGSLIH